MPPSQGLIDPLSERELDVLRLLGSDLGGPEISRELMVSLNTLRTHTKNVYAKLGVTSRREAVRRAAELGLLTTEMITRCGDDRSPHRLLACEGDIDPEHRAHGSTRSASAATSTPAGVTWFDGMTLTPDEDGTTVVRGVLADQAALHGVLQRLRDAGLPLISIIQLDDSEERTMTTPTRTTPRRRP